MTRHFIILFLLISLGCSAQENVPKPKVLVVYLSRTNNTKAVAEIIHEYVGGKIVALELKTPYPEDYKTTVDQVVKENESGFLPPLKTVIDNIQQYDIVFVGFPTWGMKLPPPMKSFLTQYDLSGKTVVPFNTNGGYGIGSTFDTVKELCPRSKILDGYSVKGGVERDGILFVMKDDKEKQVRDEVKEWLNKIKIAQLSSALSVKQQSIVTISAFTANGDLPRLNESLHAGLDAGLTISEIQEVIVQLYAYAGFPRSLNALHTFMEVLKERNTKGINDAPGKAASPYPSNKTKLEFGTENQTRLVGTPVKGEVYEFAPAIDQFLKEHLFGDIFGRDILDFKTREIATISTLATLTGTANQLRSHFNVGLHNGLTGQQLEQIVSIIKTKVGGVEADNAMIVLQSILKRSPEPNKNFTGNAYVNMIVSPDDVFNTQMASVTFEAGARTNWHYHPSGQILLITDGTAYYQEKGKPKQTLLKGQVAKCSPNVMHWHGATPGSSMTHLVVSSDLEKGAVVWLEKVTDEEYNSNAKN